MDLINKKIDLNNFVYIMHIDKMSTLTATQGRALAIKLAETTNMDIKEIQDLFQLIRTQEKRPQQAKKRGDMTPDELAAARLKDIERKKKRYAEDEEYRQRILAANNRWNQKHKATVAQNI